MNKEHIEAYATELVARELTHFRLRTTRKTFCGRDTAQEGGFDLHTTHVRSLEDTEGPKFPVGCKDCLDIAEKAREIKEETENWIEGDY